MKYFITNDLYLYYLLLRYSLEFLDAYDIYNGYLQILLGMTQNI